MEDIVVELGPVHVVAAVRVHRVGVGSPGRVQALLRMHNFVATGTVPILKEQSSEN